MYFIELLRWLNTLMYNALTIIYGTNILYCLLSLQLYIIYKFLLYVFTTIQKWIYSSLFSS